jgi:ubiquinone/menaquinone biosynthesis C-methylase UbiE
MHAPEQVFGALELKEGDVFVDLGCGAGEYALCAARLIGESGAVYALDRLSDAVEEVRRRGSANPGAPVRGVVADLTETLPLDDGIVDVCFLCTVLHGIDGDAKRRRLFAEMYRVLEPEGRVAVVECKKEASRFGPPENMRLSESDVDALACGAGFSRKSATDLGYNYLLVYEKARARCE